MRLKKNEQIIIKQTIWNIDPNARIYLFGSRVDDQQKGGDIDLLVLSKQINHSEQRKIKTRLYDLIGEQKIDLIVTDDISKPFIKLALRDAILLE